MTQTAMPSTRPAGDGVLDNIQALGPQGRNQSTQGVIVQQHCLLVLNQPQFDFGTYKGLTSLQAGINGGLGQAKGDAARYLDVVQPRLISTLTDIASYIDTHNAVGAVLKSEMGTQETAAMLRVIQEQTSDFRSRAAVVAADLTSLRSKFAEPSGVMKKNTADINTLLGGSPSALKEYETQLETINRQIEAVADSSLSTLTVVAGGILIVVGAIGTVAAGFGTSVIVGGVLMVTGGTADRAGTLAKLQERKSAIVSQQTNLKDETRLAAASADQLRLLDGSASGAADAAQSMASAWNMLGSDLDTLIQNVIKGQTGGSDLVRRLFTNAARNKIDSLAQDTAIIRQQVSGVQTRTDTSKPIGQLVRELTTAA